VLRSVEAVAGETTSDETMMEVRRLVTEVSPTE
jgi:fructose-specific phosphotransferase system component IIB